MSAGECQGLQNHKSPLEASANRHRSASTPEIINSIICSPRFHTYTTGSHTHDHLWLLSACKFRRYILQDYTRTSESWQCRQRQVYGYRPDRVLFPPRRQFAESAASSQPVPRQSGSAMQTCRFISSVNSTFMGSFLLSPDDDIEKETLASSRLLISSFVNEQRPHAGELVQLLGGFAYRHSGQQALAVIVKRQFLPVLPIAQHFENFRIRKRLSADSLSMLCSVILLLAAEEAVLGGAPQQHNEYTR